MVKYIADKIGFSDMPRTADIQEEYFRKESLSYDDKSKAQPGDLVFFKKPDQDYVHHVGVIKSGTNFIHEPCTGRNAEDTGDIDKRSDFYAIGDIRALWEKKHSGTQPTPYGGTSQTEDKKEETKEDNQEIKTVSSTVEAGLGTGKKVPSFKDMDDYMNTRIMGYTSKDIDKAVTSTKKLPNFGRASDLEGYQGIPNNLIDQVNDDESVITSKLEAQQTWIDEHKPTTLAEAQKEVSNAINVDTNPTVIEPKLETSKVFDEDFMQYFKKEIARLDERIDKVEKGLAPTNKKEVKKELDKKDKQIDELQKKVDKKDKDLDQKTKEKKTTLESIKDTIGSVFESITNGWTVNGKHKIRFKSEDAKPGTQSSVEQTKESTKNMSLDERIKHEQWKKLEDAPEIARRMTSNS